MDRQLAIFGSQMLPKISVHSSVAPRILFQCWGVQSGTPKKQLFRRSRVLVHAKNFSCVRILPISCIQQQEATRNKCLALFFGIGLLEAIKAMVSEVDLDGDGEISFDEFVLSIQTTSVCVFLCFIFFSFLFLCFVSSCLPWLSSCGPR